MTAPMSLRALATIKGKGIFQRDANPCRESYARQEDMSQRVVGLNPGADEIFYFIESP